MKKLFIISLILLLSFLKIDYIDATTETYNSPGRYTMDVSDYNFINVELWGAGGGGAGNDPGIGQSGEQGDGGDGGYIKGGLDVSSFNTLEIYVGEGGGKGMQGTEGYGQGGWGRASGGDGSATIAGASDAGGGGGSTEILGDGEFLVAADAGGGGSAYFGTRTGSNWRHGGGGGGSGGDGGRATSGNQDHGEDAETSSRGGASHRGGDGGDCCPDNTYYHGGNGGFAYNSFYISLQDIGTGQGGAGGDGRQSSSGGEDGQDGRVDVEVLPPEFEIINLSTNKNSYFTEEDIDVNIRVHNSGSEEGTQTIETMLGDFEYYYEREGTRMRAQDPRCDCDDDPEEETCPPTFSATASSPDTCYDHFSNWLRTDSRIYNKNVGFSSVVDPVDGSHRVDSQHYKTITHTITAPDNPGSFNIRAATEDDEESVEVEVFIPEPANFELEKRENSFAWSPDGIEEEEESSVRVSVENTGDLEDCQDIIYEIPGVGVDSEEVCLEGGESQYWGPILEINPSFGDVGDYNATVRSDDDEVDVGVEIKGIPSVSNLEASELTGCGHSNPVVDLRWDYEDRNSPESEQQGFEILIEGDDEVYNRTIQGSTETFNLDDHFDIDFESEYEWSLRVENDYAWSDWEDGDLFETATRYPEPDFEYTPESPFVDEKTTFTDDSTVFVGSLDDVEMSWDFGSGSTPERYKEGDWNDFSEVATEYDYFGRRSVSLSITDIEERTCTIEKPIDVRRDIPDWQETGPTDF